MVGSYQVVSERENSWEGKNGKITQKILALLDLSERPFLNTVDYILTDAEEPVYYGQSKGQTLTIGFEELRIDFGGRVQYKGQIIEG